MNTIIYIVQPLELSFEASDIFEIKRRIKEVFFHQENTNSILNSFLSQSRKLSDTKIIYNYGYKRSHEGKVIFNNIYDKIIVDSVDYEKISAELLLETNTLCCSLILRMPLRRGDLKSLVNNDAKLLSELRSAYVVKEGDNEPKSLIVSDLIKSAQNFIFDRINSININIRPNTANTTVFHVNSEYKNFKKLNKFESILNNLERFDTQCSFKQLANNIFYRQGSRYHFVVAQSNDIIERIMSIHFYSQNIWFRLNIIGEQASTIVSNIDAKRTIDKDRDNYRALLYAIQTIKLLNESFKTTIESDSSKIYEPLESKWNIMGSIEKIEDTLSILSKLNDESQKEKTDESLERQNKTLLFLTCIQMLGITSIWSDYITLIQDKNIKKLDSLPLFIEKKSSLLILNNLFPLLLAILALATFITANYKGRYVLISILVTFLTFFILFNF